VTNPSGYFCPPEHMPPFIPGTERLIAHPRPIKLACVQAPAATDIKVPKAGGGTDAFTLLPGDWHVAPDGTRHMAGIDFLAEGFCATHHLEPEPLNPNSDVRAALLYGVWSQHGHRPIVHLAQRTSTIRVVGQITDDPAVAGKRFGYSGGTFATLVPRAYMLLGSASDHYWIVDEPLMHSLFEGLVTEIGEPTIRLAPA
jgi:hypothetical protein